MDSNKRPDNMARITTKELAESFIEKEKVVSVFTDTTGYYYLNQSDFYMKKFNSFIILLLINSVTF